MQGRFLIGEGGLNINNCRTVTRVSLKNKEDVFLVPTCIEN